MTELVLSGFGPLYTACCMSAAVAGVKITTKPLNPFASDAVLEEYRDKLPLGLAPVLEIGREGELQEAIAVAQYLVRQSGNGLLGESPQQYADILRWMCFATFDLVALFHWFSPLLGRPEMPFFKHEVEAAQSRTHRNVAYLDKVLESRTFLVGERVTLADIFVFTVLVPGLAFVFDVPFRENHVNLVRYLETVHRYPPIFEFSGPLKPYAVKAPTTPMKRDKPAAK